MDKFSYTNIITRFAPSPTGYLHLGGARTALFNWIFAKKFGGKFLLRIEDTDKARLNNDALSAIFEGLNWLGINWDDEIIYQSKRDSIYKEVVKKLLTKGHAYKCYSSKDEIENYKKKLLTIGKSTKFISPWRDGNINGELSDKHVVRLKVPETNKIILEDGVQGTITWEGKDLEDFVLLRSDGSATYNLAAVIDDHYFNITDVIRGDDHLTNTAKQKLIYMALNWKMPRFSHIPLIHGFDGKKLSKRHGAVGVNTYISEGIKSSALVRYLCQLGLDTGNDDLVSIDDVIKNFNINKIVKSPGRFDPIKLNDVCGKILRNTKDTKIISELIYFINYNKMPPLTYNQQQKIKAALPILVVRSKNYRELYEEANFLLIKDKVKISEDCIDLVNEKSISLIKELSVKFNNLEWNKENLNHSIKSLALEKNKNFKDIAKLIRIAIVGKSNSPGIIEMMIVLGRSEVIRRFNILENKNA